MECAHKETKLIIIIPGRYFLQQTERHLVSLAIRVNFPEFSLTYISKAYFLDELQVTSKEIKSMEGNLVRRRDRRRLSFMKLIYYSSLKLISLRMIIKRRSRKFNTMM